MAFLKILQSISRKQSYDFKAAGIRALKPKCLKRGRGSPIASLCQRQVYHEENPHSQMMAEVLWSALSGHKPCHSVS